MQTVLNKTTNVSINRANRFRKVFHRRYKTSPPPTFVTTLTETIFNALVPKTPESPEYGVDATTVVRTLDDNLAIIAQIRRRYVSLSYLFVTRDFVPALLRRYLSMCWVGN